MPSSVPFAVFLVGAALDVFQTLIIDLDTEGRYLFLNAVSNQLRYPNNHTHYFSFILLYLFAESNQVCKCFRLVFQFIFVVVTCWFFKILNFPFNCFNDDAHLDWVVLYMYSCTYVKYTRFLPFYMARFGLSGFKCLFMYTHTHTLSPFPSPLVSPYSLACIITFQQNASRCN